MGKALSIISRKANRFNVENRAHKVISKDKPLPAPMHPHSKQLLEKIMKETPDEAEKLHVKDPGLDNRLRSIYVTSEDPKINLETSLKEKEVASNYPKDRHTYEDPEYGYFEPAIIPKGKLTLKQAVQIIIDHQTDPKNWNKEKVANEYSLSPKFAENLVHYYRAFELFVPEKPTEKKSITGKIRTTLLSEK